MEDKSGAFLVTRLYHVLIGDRMGLGRGNAHPQVDDVNTVGQTDDAFTPRGGVLVTAGSLDGRPVGIIDVAYLMLARLVVTQCLIILVAILLERLQVKCLGLGVTGSQCQQHHDSDIFSPFHNSKLHNF